MWPIPDKAYTGKVYYYKIPDALTGAVVPTFPNDYILVEYVHLKGKEWLQALQRGSAEVFAKLQIAGLIKAGVLATMEEDQIDFDRPAYPGGGTTLGGGRSDWMGSPVA